MQQVYLKSHKEEIEQICKHTNKISNKHKKEPRNSTSYCCAQEYDAKNIHANKQSTLLV